MRKYTIFVGSSPGNYYFYASYLTWKSALETWFYRIMGNENAFIRVEEP